MSTQRDERDGSPGRAAALRRTAAVVVTYGDRASTALDAVRSAADTGLGTVVLVLNGALESSARSIGAGSSDDRVTMRTVVLPGNTGSAGGFRAGLAAALELDVDRVLLLDDDNRPDPAALNRALDLLDRQEAVTGAGRVAISCARPADRYHAALLRGEAPAAVYERAGSFLHLDLPTRLRLRRPAGGPPDDVAPVIPSGPYGGLLLSSELVKRIGLPREDFVLYEDDVEYTERIGGAGGVLVFAAGAVIREIDKMTDVRPASDPDTGSRPLLRMLRTPERERHRLYYQYRNRAFVDLRRATGAARAVFLVNAAVYLSVTTAMVATRRRETGAAWVFYRAVWDGLRGRLGITFPL